LISSVNKSVREVGMGGIAETVEEHKCGFPVV